MQFAGAVKVGEERFDLLQLAQTVDLGMSRSTTIRIECRLRTTVVIAFGVEQIKLQLAGHHRVVALGLEAFDDLDQQVSRVGNAGGHALGRVHADLHRSGRNLAPRQAHQTACQRIGAAVDIADIPDQAGVLDVLTLHSQTEDGAGQRATAFIHGEQFFAVQQLAARHAVGVEDEQLDHVDVGVLFKEQACVFNGCEFHGKHSRWRRTGAQIQAGRGARIGAGVLAGNIREQGAVAALNARDQSVRAISGGRAE